MRDRSSRGRTALLVVALGAALIAEVLVTVTTAFIPSADDFYGATLPVGFSCFDIPLMRCPTTFSGVLFAFNVLITWIGWVVLARWSGILRSDAPGRGRGPRQVQREGARALSDLLERMRALGLAQTERVMAMQERGSAHRRVNIKARVLGQKIKVQI